MTFGAPEWFWALLILPLLAALFVRNELRRHQQLRKLVAARLLPDLAASMSAGRRRARFALALPGLACVILALTEPRMGYEIIQNHQTGLDLMIAIDTSRSMLSTDVQPDRLSRAKFAAQDLIDSLEGDRVGLIAFAGTSFVEAPLTIDYSAVENSLTALDTSTIPRGGTNIASAIREAAQAFGTGESSHRALVIFTDGEELEEDAVKAATEVKGEFRIFTVGLGTREGSLIPVTGDNGGTDFLKDDQGQYVRSRLDEAKLKAIAEATGGFYVHLENGPATAKVLIEQGLSKMQEHEFQTKETLPIERYEWPLAAGILLLLASMLIKERRRIVERRRPAPARRQEAVALAAVAALAMLWPAHGWAVNQGLSLYDQKDYKGAYNVFQQQLQQNPNSDGLEFDQGASAYKEGDYDKALEAFGKVLGSSNQSLRDQAEYNLGNTLVQRGALQDGKDEKIKEWTEALKHYDQALKVDPGNADAKYNEDVVRKMIQDLNKKQQQQQNQQQQQQQQQQQKQQQQNQNQQNQQAQNQPKQGQQQQNQQSQNQQQQGQQGQQGQQQQNQQAQNQQQQGQQGQQGQQQQNQQAQNQQQQGQQNQQGQQQNQQAQNQQQQSGQQGQQQNQQGDQGSQNQQQTAQQKQGGQNQDQASANGASPSPTPANGPGVLKEQSQQAQQQAAAQAAARAATESAKAGEMTPSQAQALVDSLRGEEQHVSFEDRKDDNEPVYKDW